MANLSPAILILILIVGVVVALVVGYFLGSRFGGKKSVAVREATEKHNSYKNDVREHFERTSAIMSRMVDDYRDMYQHMAEGADKLAEMHPEKLVTPPPAPDAITRDTAVEGAQNSAPSTNKAQEKGKPAAGKPADAGGQSSASAEPAKDSESGAQARAADTTQDKPATGATPEKSAPAGEAGASEKPASSVKASDEPGKSAAASDTSSRSAASGDDKSGASGEKASSNKKDGKRYGLE
jgi:uncharacterized membrane-anchored protein YhcB (DUF1043 family)